MLPTPAMALLSSYESLSHCHPTFFRAPAKVALYGLQITASSTGRFAKEYPAHGTPALVKVRNFVNCRRHRRNAGGSSHWTVTLLDPLSQMSCFPLGK